MLKNFLKNLGFVFGILAALALIVGMSFLSVEFGDFLMNTFGMLWGSVIVISLVGVFIAALFTMIDQLEQ